jgi:DNA/RNA-binding domain of Phe-tRNA-synthetase-like protein
VSELSSLDQFLAETTIDSAVLSLRPDYRAVLIAVEGITPGPSDEVSETLLKRAEESARAALVQQPVEEISHVAAWRDAFRSFGAKPQRTRNSLEALLRRAATGLPRVNRLTDIYNALSILHLVPIGGEDLSSYIGSPRLIRATGSEPFEILTNGVPATEFPDPGEVVWADAEGVTCRRWNWRQGRRTQLRDSTTAALFILDALEPLSDAALMHAAEELTRALVLLGPDVCVAERWLYGTTQPHSGAETL